MERKERIPVYLSQGEYQLIRAVAGSLGLSASEFLRVAGQEKAQRDNPALYEALKHLLEQNNDDDQDKND
jgi:hypothetical protein